MTIEFSKYQRDIFDWVINGRGDAVVQAVAGAGKTFTLVETAKLLKSNRAVFLAFNKHIAQQLQERLGSSMVAKTIHSVGLATLRKVMKKPIVDDNKYYDIGKAYAQGIADDLRRKYSVEFRKWLESKEDNLRPEEPLSAAQVNSQLKQLSHYTKVTLTNEKDFNALEKMVNHFGCLDSSLDLKQLHYPLMSIFREGQQIAEREGIIDYDDMLWLPNRWNLYPSKCDWIAIDEAQDVSPAQLDLILKMRSLGGRMIWVGDKFQAIFGFAGAMNDSLDQIIAATNATVLPLSISYRCPTSHIKLAQEIVPSIESAPSAIEGTVEYIAYDKVHEVIAEGDLVISRCTAPAVKLCIELIGKKIPARVRGRDIGKALTTIVKEVAAHPEFQFTPRHFGYYLREYQDTRIAKLMQKKNSESQIESLRDRIQGIWVCYEAFDCDNVLDFCAEIEQLFSDSRSSVMLSTVHRAKGLESDRVFILEPDKLPLRWKNQLDWQLEQEKNLVYVSRTRAKKALFFITNSKSIEEEMECLAAEEDEEEDEDEDEEKDIFF